MNKADYLQQRQQQTLPQPRVTCPRCWKAVVTCYCHVLQPFVAPVRLVILQHNQEAANAVATGRMAHLALSNSELVIGRSFAGHPRVEALLAETGVQHMLLFPSPGATPLAEVVKTRRVEGAPEVVFWLLDATWSQVPKMLRLSPAVKSLPRVAFTPRTASVFQIRRQPDAACLSTIEAAYEVLDLVASESGQGDRRHEALMTVFRHLVAQQLTFVDAQRETRHQVAKRARQARRGLAGLPVTV